MGLFYIFKYILLPCKNDEEHSFQYGVNALFYLEKGEVTLDKRIGFVSRIKQLFGKLVDVDEVGIESYLFEHSEIDPSVIPSEHLLLLPDPVQFDTFVYVEEDGKEWIAGMGYDSITYQLVYEVWICDGRTIAYELYNETKS